MNIFNFFNKTVILSYLRGKFNFFASINFLASFESELFENCLKSSKNG